MKHATKPLRVDEEEPDSGDKEEKNYLLLNNKWHKMLWIILCLMMNLIFDVDPSCQSETCIHVLIIISKYLSQTQVPRFEHLQLA